ncbi:hemerythrin domain-containing protein [Salibacterium salarium]|nr:hemerythrin domain-containing protein [Salibacterium salarium]
MGKYSTGIIRHEALQPLSRHHREALFTAINLKRAGTDKARFSLKKVLSDTKEYWEKSGKRHLRQEEEILLSAFAEFRSLDCPEIKEMLEEHVNIRAQMNKLLSKGYEDNIEEMNKTGELLEDHIRKEERRIYPFIEKALSEEKLKELVSLLHERTE